MAPIVDRLANGPPVAGGTITIYQPGRRDRFELGELDALARKTAAYLTGLGIRAGDRIGIAAPNCVEWVLLDLAAIKLKVVTAGFEVGKFAVSSDLLDRYGLRLLFAHRGAGDDRIRSIAELLPALSGITDPPELAPVVYAPADVTTIKFTSGSTGQPKGLAATVGSIDSSITAVQRLFGHAPPDCLFVFLPLSLLQQRYWIYSALVHGHDVVVATYELAFHALRREQPTVVMGVPAFYETLRRQITALAQADVGSENAGREALRARACEVLGSRIRYLWTGSAPASPDVLAFLDGCGMPIFEGYGMNETCIVTKNAPGAHRRGSVGRPLDGKTVFLDDRNVVNVRSDYPVNTRYLYCAAGESERIFGPDGTVHTGDIGRIDADGYLYILGRADDIIVLANGRNVMVRKVEERLKACDVIDDCILAGFGRDHLLAVVCATDGGAVRERIAAHIAEVNREHGTDERIGGFVVIDEPFSIENGLLTSQYKPRRKVILERYQDEIQRGYGGLQ